MVMVEGFYANWRRVWWRSVWGLQGLAGEIAPGYKHSSAARCLQPSLGSHGDHRQEGRRLLPHFSDIIFRYRQARNLNDDNTRNSNHKIQWSAEGRESEMFPCVSSRSFLKVQLGNVSPGADCQVPRSTQRNLTTRNHIWTIQTATPVQPFTHSTTYTELS